MKDLISAAVGGRVVVFNDEFFAEADNLIKPSDPVWKEDEYTDRGKWMDGWETRRRREPGHDWCVLALGVPGRVDRVTIDTSHFTGNYPEEFSLEACGVGDVEGLEMADWVELIPRTHLEGDTVTVLDVADHHRVTHVRLNIFPDGGVARLRVDGEPIPARQLVCSEGVTDLVSAAVGGVALDASDVHYSAPSNLLRGTPSAGMWDGWETKRRRGPGHDWVTFRLGLPGVVQYAQVDTTHFKGNSPGWVSVGVSEDGEAWSTVIDRVEVDLNSLNDIELGEPTHAVFVKLSIHPDGGVARFRVFGRPDRNTAGEKRIEYLNALFDQEAHRFFHTSCASERWIEAMLAARPFVDVAAVLSAAGSAFDALGDEDWLEAFAGHPRIGERGDAMSAQEQVGAVDAEDDVKSELDRVNRAYEEKFGFIYIVSASGKTGKEMVDIAKQRLGNTREEEIANASAEQWQITETRLRRMLCQEIQ